MLFWNLSTWSRIITLETGCLDDGRVWLVLHANMDDKPIKHARWRFLIAIGLKKLLGVN